MSFPWSVDGCAVQFATQKKQKTLRKNQKEKTKRDTIQKYDI